MISHKPFYFSLPVRTEMHNPKDVVAQVLAGKTVTIGSSKIRSDGDWLCVTDAYGCDQYGELTETSIRAAIEHVIAAESAPVGDHPAERNYSP